MVGGSTTMDLKSNAKHNRFTPLGGLVMVGKPTTIDHNANATMLDNMSGRKFRE